MADDNRPRDLSARPSELPDHPSESEPPIVARLVIEIRSDGRRTIARGAMEDAVLGQKVAVEAHGTTPLSLAWSLAKSLTRLPSFARAAAAATRGLLPGRK
jgi:hypothetical protein